MNLEKQAALVEYLGLDMPEEIESINQDPDNDRVFEYDGYEYEIYSEDELNNVLSDVVDDFKQETQRSIDELEDIVYLHYMNISVDETAIIKDIEENFTDYVGSGEYTEVGNFLIFPR